VRGDGTAKDYQMPFVNRVEELWRLFETNARNMHTLRSLPTVPDNFRHFQLLYCIQYFGSGKTTLGKQFGAQLALGVLDERNKGGLTKDYQQLRNTGIDHVHVDVRGGNNMVHHVVRTVTDDYSVVWVDEGDAARQVVAAAHTRGKPILIHIDEVGAQKGHELYSLQTFAACIFAELWRVGHKDFSQMPTIYFLVTGKSTDFFWSGGHSPVCSEVLVLDMLSAQHVGQVRKYLQKLDEPVQLLGLTGDLEGHLDTRLCAATGGAPRLLLYTLRALHYACVYKGVRLNSKASIDDAVDHQVYKILDSVPGVRRVMAAERPDAAEPSVIISDLDSVLARKGIRAAASDKYGALSDATLMADVMAMIGEELGFSEEDLQRTLDLLEGQRIRTVGCLRVLTPADIDSLDVPLVLKALLRRVNAKNT
jgi:hypothetical protein